MFGDCLVWPCCSLLLESVGPDHAPQVVRFLATAWPNDYGVTLVPHALVAKCLDACKTEFRGLPSAFLRTIKVGMRWHGVSSLAAPVGQAADAAALPVGQPRRGACGWNWVVCGHSKPEGFAAIPNGVSLDNLCNLHSSQPALPHPTSPQTTPPLPHATPSHLSPQLTSSSFH